MSLISLVLDFLIVLAAVGLSSSLIVHLVEFFKRTERLNKIRSLLYNANFFIFIPAIFIASDLTSDSPRNQFWQIIIMNCPEWMKYETYFFIYYGMFWITIALLKTIFSLILKNTLETDNSNGLFFNLNTLSKSGANLSFYAYYLTIYYSALQVYRQ